jgi:hypothetical protein
MQWSFSCQKYGIFFFCSLERISIFYKSVCKKFHTTRINACASHMPKDTCKYFLSQRKDQ